MTDIDALAQNLLRQLKVATSHQDQPEVDRYILALENALLTNEAFLSSMNERVLAQALHVLAPHYGPENLRILDGLRMHFSLVQMIHDRLFSVLDPGIDLGELLFLHLDKWPGLLDDSVGCRFDGKSRELLADAREKRDSCEALRGFFQVYFECLRDCGLDEVVGVLEPNVQSAIAGYERAHYWTVNALFVSPLSSGEVRGLRVRPQPAGTGSISCINEIDYAMKTAANKAMVCVKDRWPRTRSFDFTWEIEGGEVAFSGDSVGLALVIGILATVEPFDIDAYTAFTGDIDWATGDIRRVEYLAEKLEAAKQLGIRRVFVPHSNENDIPVVDGIEIIGVTSVAAVIKCLQSKDFAFPERHLERIALARVRELELELNDVGIRKVRQFKRNDYCTRTVFTDYRHEVFVEVFHKTDLKPVVQNKQVPLMRTIQEKCSQVFNIVPKPEKVEGAKRQYKSYLVSNPSDQSRVKDFLSKQDNCLLESEPNCEYRARIVAGHQTVFVRQYFSGTLTIEGPPCPLFNKTQGDIDSVLGVDSLPEVAVQEISRLQAQIGDVEAVPLGNQWIGTDESGKGDYFGPLVGAAVMVDRRTAELLAQLGVKDSKRLSDKRASELAGTISQELGSQAQTVVISPEKYNQLYAQFQTEGKNLNTLLAWAHARALENILAEHPQESITVLVDKFADEEYIHSKLLEQGRQTDLQLVQLPKAEANIAVAAASVLARAQFLRWIDRLSKKYAVQLPKGASDPRIVEVGKRIVKEHGRDELGRVAKLHFKTTSKILG